MMSSKLVESTVEAAASVGGTVVGRIEVALGAAVGVGVLVFVGSGVEVGAGVSVGVGVVVFVGSGVWVGIGVKVGSSVSVALGVESIVASIVGTAVSIDTVGVALGSGVCPCATIGQAAIHNANAIDPIAIQRFNAE
jgi:hypothetical protein